MEDGFGTIIYIILIAVGLIVTALGRKKKQKEGAPVQNTGKPTVTDPFSLFDFESDKLEEELVGDEVITPDIAPPVTNELGMVIEEGVSSFKNGVLTSEKEEELLKKSMETDNPEHQTPEDLSELYGIVQKDSEMEKIMNEFDLRKAVIHSEILKRKEF